MCQLQHPHHYHPIRPPYVTPPTPKESTLTIDTTGNTTTACYVTASTLAITNRTTTLTISITATTRGANTTSSSDSNNSDRLTHQPHNQLTHCLHRHHLHYRPHHPHQRQRKRRNHPMHHPRPHHQHHQHPPPRHLQRPRHLPTAHTEEVPKHPLNLSGPPHDRDPPPSRGTRANRRNTPNPKGQRLRGTEQQSEHATTCTRRPRKCTPPRNTAATPSRRFPGQDVRCSPLPVG